MAGPFRFWWLYSFGLLIYSPSGMPRFLVISLCCIHAQIRSGASFIALLLIG